jgi:hypothetical protein
MDTTTAHEYSANHRSQVEASDVCGCFYCTLTFKPSEIKEWVDRDDTALCPHCGIDAVIGSKSGAPLTQEFLSEMRQRWF